MQIEALRSLRSVGAPAALSLGLALSYSHLALAGVSNFSISSPPPQSFPAQAISRSE